MYRCKISDGISTVYTDVALLQLDTALIGEHPEDFVGIEGTRATFAITPRGENLTYQWEVSTDDGATWKNSIANGNQTVSIWMNLYANYSGRQYRCKVTDANGNTQYSNPATLSLAMQEWQYEYNADGLRTKRTNGYSTYEYVYLNGQLVRMLVDGNTLSFHYDADGKPMSFVYNGTTYYYATNLQGDIVAILSKEGTQVVAYSYDAWGNILSITGTKADTIGKYNPLRYRGYVYDTESKLYYLQSRYYDPAIGRFINADCYISTGYEFLGFNMFAYCLNNPVSLTDPSGYLAAVGTAVVSSLWNPVTLLAAIAIVATVAIADIIWDNVYSPQFGEYTTIQSKNSRTSKQKHSTSIQSGETTSPTPPKGPNKNSNNRYEGKTLYEDDNIHIDYEYNGNGTGNVHLQVKGTSAKYYFDASNKVLRTGRSVYSPLAPRPIQKYLRAPRILYALEKGAKFVEILGG